MYVRGMWHNFGYWKFFFSAYTPLTLYSNDATDTDMLTRFTVCQTYF